MYAVTCRSTVIHVMQQPFFFIQFDPFSYQTKKKQKAEQSQDMLNVNNKYKLSQVVLYSTTNNKYYDFIA